jgi:hypothetical protein
MPAVSSARPHEAKHRRRFRERTGRLYSLPQMAELMGIHDQTLRARLRRNNGSAPPAFQPGGPGTPWVFAEASYLQWITEQEGKRA